MRIRKIGSEDQPIEVRAVHRNSGLLEFLAFVGVVVADTVGLWLLFESGMLSTIIEVLIVVVSAAMTYGTLARLLNFSCLTATAAGLTIKQRPIPWFGTKWIAKEEVSSIQVFDRPLQWNAGNLSRFQLIAMTSRAREILFEVDDITSEALDELAGNVLTILGAESDSSSRASLVV